MFIFCKPISTKKRFQPNRKLNDTCSFTLFDSADNIKGEDWDEILKGRNLFLDRAYLKIIEQCSHSLLKPRYLLIYLKGKPCAIFYFQVVDFKAGVFKNLFDSDSDISNHSLFKNYIEANKEETLLRLFTVGNNLISGQHGFMFDDSVTQRKGIELLKGITDLIAREEKMRSGISSILIKDFENKLPYEKLLNDENYIRFSVEPNLIIDLKKEMNDLESYIGQFSKKYRNRAKTILKTGEVLEKRELSLKEVCLHEKEIYNLYSQVFEHAKFKLLKLPLNYFSEVKKQYSDFFHIVGFFHNEQLIAFTSFFNLSDKTLEAHYIGFDYEHNKNLELYQNILYENIKQGIKYNCSQVNLGRTAAEIKTTVGAKPVELLCYAKPQNTISRMLMKTLVSFLQPGDWTPRNPYKETVNG
ncbi:MAG: hypothetical protein IPM51_16750 [Sphingobacteriaceae bacterium]|nr:hypothetical protein [Sphingobacteriaceae bacterium]